MINATQIAGIINSEMLLAFNKVPFIELMRAASSCKSDIIAQFLDRVSATRNELCCRFQELYELKAKYEEVEIVRSIRT
jgi:hypothetical protein